jgi:tetratricopeptide (TPR) repeat protein
MGFFNIFGKEIKLDALTLIDNGENEFDKQNYSAALDYYKKALVVDKSNWYVYFKTGKCYQLSNNFTNAIKYYNKGKNYDDNLDINNGLGESYLMKSEFRQAIIYLNKALTLLRELDEINNSSSSWYKANILNNLAVGYYNIGDLEKAKDCCMNGIKADQSYPGNYGILGSICLEQKLIKEALIFLRKGEQLGDKRSKDIINDLF